MLVNTSMHINNVVKVYLSTNFDMKDLGEFDNIIGKKLNKSKSGISITLSHSIENILK